jgi:hypothetical protein
MEPLKSIKKLDNNEEKFVSDTKNALEIIKKKYSDKFNEDHMNNIIKNITLNNKKNKINNKNHLLKIKTIYKDNQKYYKDDINYLWSIKDFKRIGTYYNEKFYIFSEKYKKKNKLVLKKKLI